MKKSHSLSRSDFLKRANVLGRIAKREGVSPDQVKALMKAASRHRQIAKLKALRTKKGIKLNPPKTESAKLSEYGKRDMLGSKSGAGIDPEILEMGTVLTAFHVEAGARKFVDLVHAITSDLEVEKEKICPYLRSWYNGARDLLEDFGFDITGMDTPEEVRATLNELSKESSSSQGLE
jgi:hypothetical protein